MLEPRTAGAHLLDTVDVLRVLNVAGRDLRGEAAVLELVPDGQGDDASAALPDALDGLVQLGHQVGRALEHGVVDGDGGGDARVSALGGAADGQERDDVAAVGVQPEVVVGLLAVERGLARHLRTDEAERHSEAARLGAQAGGGLEDEVAHVGRHAEVHHAELVDRVLVHRPARTWQETDEAGARSKKQQGRGMSFGPRRSDGKSGMGWDSAPPEFEGTLLAHMLEIMTAPAPFSSSSASCVMRLATVLRGKLSTLTLSGTRPASFSPSSAHSMGGSQVLENWRAAGTHTVGMGHRSAPHNLHPTCSRCTWSARVAGQGIYRSPVQQARPR